MALAQEQEIYPGSRLTMMEVFRNILLTEFNKIGDMYLDSLRSFFNHRNTHISLHYMPENQVEEIKRAINDYCGNVIAIYKNEMIRLVEREFRFDMIKKCHQVNYVRWHLHFYTLTVYERIRDELDHQGYHIPRKLVAQVETQKKRINELLNRLNQQGAGGEWTLSLFNKKGTLYLAIREAVKYYPQSDTYRCLYGDAPPALPAPPPPPPPPVQQQQQHQYQQQQHQALAIQAAPQNNSPTPVYHQLQPAAQSNSPDSYPQQRQAAFPNLPPPPAITPLQPPPPLTYHPYMPIHNRY